jgi:hypothetical protein
MAATRFTSTADHHTNTIRADSGNGVRTVTDLLFLARTGVLTIAANYGSSAHRSGVNHV